MDKHIDFLQMLQTDIALNILMFLDDPADLVRASSVSRFWRCFVIANGLSKQLCVRKFPQLSSIASTVKPNGRLNDVDSSDSAEWKIHERDHNVYASLLQALNKSIMIPTNCIKTAISASSTDRYPDESIINTLIPRERFIYRGSYWSSKGQHDPAVPETLVYKLIANLGVVTEIKIQPFEAFFESGKPIYSPRSVRFRMGHPKSPNKIEQDLLNLPMLQPADEKFVWTYTSQEFPMAQENRLQQFKLPKPVLCIGGFLQVELLGRVQREEIDGLFYICVAHVQVVGRPLSPAFDIEILEPSGKFLLKYYLEGVPHTLRSTSNDKNSEHIRVLSEREGFWGPFQMMEYLLLANPPGEPLHWNEADNVEFDESLPLNWRDDEEEEEEEDVLEMFIL